VSKSRRVLQHPIIPLLALMLLSLPALYPLFVGGFAKTHDASVHLIRLYLLDEQVRAGNFFPRWLPDLMTGYGYPTFNFYAPLIYAVAEIMHLAGASLPYALTILMMMLIGTAAWGMWFLASDLYRPKDRKLEDGTTKVIQPHWAGIAAGVAYIYTPYLLVNLYVRGALAELLAQALLPWLFWSIARLFTAPTPRRYAIAAAALLGAIALGHNITLLLLPLLLGPYLILVWLTSPLARSERFVRLRAFVGYSLIVGGMTAFFWVPLLAERNLLSKSAFNAPDVEEHVWSFSTFLEFNFPYDYAVSSIPFRLGLAQAFLVLGGLLLTRRRLLFWWFWVALGGIALICVTPLILPLWRAVELLSIVQFPWRFLTVVSLATALVSGGIVMLAQRTSRQAMLTALVVAIAIAGGRPMIALFDTSMYDDIAVDPAAIARYEAGYGAWGAGWHREFLPKWAEAFDSDPENTLSDGERSRARENETTLQTALTNKAFEASGPEKVSLELVSPTRLKLSVWSAAPTTLRLNQFYFPGWSARIDQGPILPTYPSTQQGIVTVDLPAGEQRVEIGWTDSWIENAAEWLSILTLLILGIALAWRRRRLAAALACAAAVGLALILRSPLQSQSEPLTLVHTEVLPGFQLLGYQTNLSANGRSLLLTPFWYNQRRFERLSVGWRLVDEDGTVMSQIHSAPYYGTQSAGRWHPGSVIRDGYRLPLPTGTPAGDYRLEVRIDAETEKTKWLPVGIVSAPSGPVYHPIGAVFTDPQSREQVELTGYTLAVNGAEQDVASNTLPVARPGDRVTIRLYWRALRMLSEDYHSFIHLVNHERQTLTALDKIPGQEIARPRFWDLAYPESDTYPLTIPSGAESGLYYPRVGFYDYDDMERFLLEDGNGTSDALDLAPIKIIAPQKAAPKHPLRVRYGEFAQLLGYTLTPEAASLQPGSIITLTLFYQGLQPATRPYTQFFHLYAPELGMAAQIDQPPLRGGNPTDTWQPDEIIVEQIRLTVNPGAPPGDYTLYIGMYDPENGERVLLTDEQGATLVDRQLPLVRIRVSESVR
jgi:hypothetical protein